jgi:hypothetical protein
MNELTEGIDALAERRKMERERLDERLGKNRERVNQEELYAPHMEEEQYINRDQFLKDYAAIVDKCRKESEEIEQILGKALGYPWYKDDPKNFPNATEADGVCVGVETAWSLAMIAVDKIKELEERNKKLSKRHPTKEEALAQYEWLKANSKRNKETE